MIKTQAEHPQAARLVHEPAAVQQTVDVRELTEISTFELQSEKEDIDAWKVLRVFVTTTSFFLSNITINFLEHKAYEISYRVRVPNLSVSLAIAFTLFLLLSLPTREMERRNRDTGWRSPLVGGVLGYILCIVIGLVFDWVTSL